MKLNLSYILPNWISELHRIFGLIYLNRINGVLRNPICYKLICLYQFLFISLWGKRVYLETPTYWIRLNFFLIFLNLKWNMSKTRTGFKAELGLYETRWNLSQNHITDINIFKADSYLGLNKQIATSHLIMLFGILKRFLYRNTVEKLCGQHSWEFLELLEPWNEIHTWKSHLENHLN